MCKVISLLMSLLMCFTLSVTASKAVSELLTSSKTADCESYVKGNSEVIKITAEQYLRKLGFLWIWTTYDGAEWTETVNTPFIAMSNTKTGLSSGRYRLKTVFTLTDKNSKTETITVYSDEKSVGQKNQIFAQKLCSYTRCLKILTHSFLL